MQDHVHKTLIHLSKRLKLAAEQIETELRRSEVDINFVQSHTASVAKDATGILALTTLVKPPPDA